MCIGKYPKVQWTFQKNKENIVMYTQKIPIDLTANRKAVFLLLLFI